MLVNGLTNAIRRPIHNAGKKLVGVHKHSWGVRKHSQGLGKIRNMLLIFIRKA